MKTPLLCQRRAAQLALLGWCLAGFARPAAADARSSAHYNAARGRSDCWRRRAHHQPDLQQPGRSRPDRSRCREPKLRTRQRLSEHLAGAQPDADAARFTLFAEATSASGAVVAFTPTAIDENGGPVTATANPPSGSTFSLGDTTVIVSATATGSPATGSFVVRVRDTKLALREFWLRRQCRDRRG